MAVYKVPQDVEADDKLIGPFSFRQFIYLIIVAVAGFIAYVLSKVFIGLIIVPLPIILLFGALALPLRKDQPMETYLVAVIRFFLKPRMRLWSPDGSIALVSVTAPQEVTEHLTKDIAGSEASRRLSYLAQVVDTGGWASRGVGQAAMSASNLNDTIAAEATNATDILDDYAGVNQSFNSMIERRDEQHRQQLMGQMRQIAQQSEQPAAPTAPAQPPSGPQYRVPQSYAQSAPQPAAAAPQPAPTAEPSVAFNPYPSSMHQHVVQPYSPAAPQPTAPPNYRPATTQQVPQAGYPQQPVVAPVAQPTETMAETVSPDIMRLASNKDLSISAIAHEAHRLENKEVVISLHDR